MLSPITLKAFNPKTEKSYTLEVPSQHFDIQQVDTDSLVDKVDSPNVLKEDWSWLGYTIWLYHGIFSRISDRTELEMEKETDP